MSCTRRSRIFNYLDQPQRIALDVAPGDWYELTGDPPQTVEIGAQ
jgi:CD109 antigen